MKKIFVAIVVIVSLCPVTSSFAFLDYLFSGSSSRDAIDNSAVGDLRAWWTGNPAYTFNPYYSGAGMPQGQQQPGQAPQAAQPQLQQQPTVNYYPPSQGERLIHTLNNRLRPNRFPSNKCNMAMDNLNNLINPRECSLRFNIRQPLSLISISKRTHSNDIGLKSLPSIMMSDGIVYLELF